MIKKLIFWNEYSHIKSTISGFYDKAKEFCFTC